MLNGPQSTPRFYQKQHENQDLHLKHLKAMSVNGKSTCAAKDNEPWLPASIQSSKTGPVGPRAEWATIAAPSVTLGNSVKKLISA